MKTHYNISSLEESTETLRAIAHPLRIEIIRLLHERQRMSVTEIYEALAIEQAVASHHLRIMKSKNIVGVSREGKSSFYSLKNKTFFDIVDLTTRVVFAK